MDSAAAGGKLVFTFPGQGSYHAQVLAELFERYPYRAQFEAADRTSRRILGHEFLPLAAANPVHREQALTACPYLDQLAIYVTDVLIADLLMNAGVRPDLLLGHSFGELAALAVGGAYSFETGLQDGLPALRLRSSPCGPALARWRRSLADRSRRLG